MNDKTLLTSPWPRRWVSTLALSTTLAFTAPAWAETDFSEADTEELEITLEVFDDSEELEAFELRLEEEPRGRDRDVADNDRGESSDFEEMDERMDRFEEEVAAASETDRVRDAERDSMTDRVDGVSDESDRGDEMDRELENDRIADVTEFDSADEMDELDLAEEQEPEEETDEGEFHEEDDIADEELAELEEEVADEEIADEEVADEEVVDEEVVLEETEETDELAEEEEPAD